MQEIGRLCSDLVRIRSENPPGKTEAVITYIGELLNRYGVPSTITDDGCGRCNLITDPVDTGLLVCGHVDVVPALDDGWTEPPFSGAIRNGIVWGRGTTDMKGGCAALIIAYLSFLDKYGQRPAQMAFVCDEETGGESGIRHLIRKNLISPCDCLIAEPTPNTHPNIGQKGLVRLELRFAGTPAHGSLYPQVGTSAIIEAVNFTGFLQELHTRKFTHDPCLEEILRRSSDVLEEEFGVHGADTILSGIMFNPGVIHGGEKSNIVAQKCDLEVEMRIPWGCNIPSLLAELRSRFPRCTVLSEISHVPSLTPPGSRIATVTCNAIRQVFGRESTPIVQWAASDARHLRQAGFPVVEYGPGNLRYLHAIDEHVSIASLEKASEVYYALMQEYAGKESPVRSSPGESTSS